MAATTITRATITDDSGNGTSGTILNAAWVGTAIYDAIDALLASNTLQLEKSNSGGAVVVRVKNSHATGNTSLIVGTNTSDNAGFLQAFGSSYSTSGSAIASTARLYSDLTGGTVFANAGAYPFRFYQGTANPVTLAGTGHLVLTEQTTNPGTGELAANAALSVYSTNNKLVFAYNNAGTITYVSLPLNGSSTTWTHSTSAP